MSSGVMVVESLRMHRGKRQILNDIDLQLHVGEVLGILGPNGAGKSSFLAACCAELPITSGQILYDGQSVLHAKPLDLARTRAVLPQHTTMTFDLPVTEVVTMGAYPFPEATTEQVNEWIDEAIERADIRHKAHDSYRALSGGEQQRVQFARVLVQARAIENLKGHAFLFLDEPTASLDPKHQVLLMRVVRELSRESSTAVVVVLHDLNMAARWCDRLMLLSDGEIAALDVPQKVLRADLLERVYGLPMSVMPHPLNSDHLIVMAEG